MVQASHPTSQFPCAYGFATRQLAYMLDSLVRVSRRAHWAPYTSILRTQLGGGAPFIPRSRPRHRPSTQRGFSRKHNPCWPAPVRKVRYTRTRARVHPGVPMASPSTISSTFYSLFKVLFIFPSRYLFAIGLSPVFSLRWDLPPT